MQSENESLFRKKYGVPLQKSMMFILMSYRDTMARKKQITKRNPEKLMIFFRRIFTKKRNLKVLRTIGSG